MQDLIIDGKITNHCPVDFHRLSPIQVSDEESVRHTISKARIAQPDWEKLSFRKRLSLLKQAGRKMLASRQEVLELLHDEAGKTLGEMLLSEAVGPLQYIQDWARVAGPYLKSRKLPISPLAFPGKKGFIETVPRGVIGIIAPWNYPLGNFFKPVFPALLCGNAVVIKPSEYSPRTAEWFVRILNEFLPPHVLNLVHGDREIGQTLIKSGIDAVTFTGSYYSGKEVVRVAAEQMIPCSIELGGKDAAIVLSDCNFDRTVAGIMHWSLHNAGQACGDIERVYVEESIADKFIQSLTAAVSALRVSTGEPQSSDVGPTVHAKQFSIIEEHVNDAISRGAKLLCGGKRTGKGLWFQPTVLDYCNHTMKIMTEPTFGPVIPIVRVQNSEEAIALVNHCDYGLNASVWSENIQAATAIARRLYVGTAFINNHAFTGAMPSAPWTGTKRSGYGIANSTLSLNHYTRPRTLVIDKKKTADAWWFPMDSMAIELGHSLAEAQLGNIKAALKLPFLISKRQRRVMDFACGEYSPSYNNPIPQNRLRRNIVQRVFRGLFKFLGENFSIPLTDRELTWAQATIESIFPSSSAEKWEPKSDEDAREFLMDFYRSAPFPANFAMRASFWIAGLSPIFKLGKLRTIEHLTNEERLSLIKSLLQSNSYFQRQIVNLIKTCGALSEASTTRFRRVTRESNKSQPHEEKIPNGPVIDNLAPSSQTRQMEL